MDLWTDDELYELAKRVNPPLRPSPPTLKVLCMDYTTNKWKYWIDLNKKLKTNTFEKMCKHKSPPKILIFYIYDI